MKKKFTKSQEEVINSCDNTYLKLIYMIDFLFKNNKATKKWCEVLNETSKTKNLKVKIVYLYLTYIINTQKHINNMILEFPDWIEKELIKDRDENYDINLQLKDLNFVSIRTKKDIELEKGNFDISDKIKIDYNIKHLNKVKVKYDNFRLNKKIERKINYD